jgi:general secretion pathway protein I
MRVDRARSRGFSLIEAIVALALIATLGAALFAWIAASLSSLARAEEASAENDARLNVLAYMQAVNPMQRPEGGADFGDLRIEWHARAAVAPQDQIGYPGGIGLYQVALYDTTVVARRAGSEQAWFEMQFRQAGWRKVREARLPF